MGVYTYKAVDSRGKTVKGELDAKDELDLSTQLAKLGYLPISIGFKGEKKPPLGKTMLKKAFSKTSLKAVIVFTRQFSTMVKASVPIIEGLTILGEQAEDKNLSEAVKQVIEDVSGGFKLSEAMAKHPHVFNELYVNTVLAGEAGGVLDKVLNRLADVLEEEEQTKNAVMTAMRYPIMVSVALVIAVIVLSVMVMPNFAGIYGSMGVDLPLPTQIMIMISNALRHYPWVFLLIGGGIFFAAKTLLATPMGRKTWDRFKFEAPTFGKVYTKVVMLRFAAMLNVLYQAGLPILKVLDIVKINVGNTALAADIDKIKNDVSDGKGVSGGILASKYFPKLVGYMVQVGEKTGVLSTMLDSLCEYYGQEVRTSLKNLTGLIEPLMTAVLGFVLMIMALAIFMPMWNMISAMKQAV